MSVPPKVVKAQVIRAMPPNQESVDGGLLSLARQYGGSPATRRPSLPVLEAFQEFIEMERRRARRRLLITATFFLILFFVLGGTVITAGILFYNSVAADMRDVRDELTVTDAQARDSEQRTQSTLERYASDALAWRGELANKTQRFLRNYSGLSDQIAKTGEDVRGLREALDELREENTAMRLQLAQQRGNPSRGQALSEESVPPVFLSVFIQPEGIDQPIPWRLPIP